MNPATLAETIGQTVFAIETNLDTLARHADSSEAARQARYGAQRSLERLKKLKVELLAEPKPELAP